MPQNLKSLVTQSLYPKITTVTTGSATAVLPAGGETVTVTGSGFLSGATVWINNSNMSTTFTSSTTLTFTSPAQSVGFYQLFVYNTDGSVATKPGGLIYNNAPVWTTPSGGLPNGDLINAYSTTLVATGGTITYSLVSGSLPTGLTLNSSTGVISGTPTSINTFNFTIAALNQYNQPTTRSFSIEIANKPSTIEYLVVAGGGGGSGMTGGGGGAGGFRTATGLPITGGVTYTVSVGGGGSGGPGDQSGSNGGSSIFSTITSTGGGGGARNGENGKAGGSGGGGGHTPGIGGAGTSGQGNNGGDGGAPGKFGGGGGGGASSAGAVGQATGTGNGGNGTASSISGSSVTYAGGGGGGIYQSSDTPGQGGTGGGGNGGNTSINPTAGTTNRGGGGGGQGDNKSLGANGGSGIVILRYLDSFAAAESTTGSPTITVTGGYRIYTFTGNGSITF